MTTSEDPELAAMAQVLKAFEGLTDENARQRVFDWMIVRLGLKDTRGINKLNSRQPANEKQDQDNPPREGTINTVALKLRASSCRTLLVTAAAYLSLYEEKDKFTRDELITCAKEARAWKADYGNQTSINIERMCKASELIEKSKGVYALPQTKLTELEQKLTD